MSADFLSGLLLLGVLLFGAGYLVWAFFWESWSDRLRRYLSDLSTRQRPPPQKPNDHLVGATGRVIDDGAKTGTVRVRVGMEIWRARATDGAPSLPVGTEVEVTAADGRMLDVRPRTVPAEVPSVPADHAGHTERAGR
ncbi:MAG TPA: NfeD family protein [Gammaproteobacteria bacterium]